MGIQASTASGRANAFLATLLAALLAATALLPFHGTASAAPCQEQVVVVGYYDADANFQSGFSDDDRKSGFAYDYYQEIAPFAGWVYEYRYGSRQEMIDALVSGDVDIVAGVRKEDAPEGALLFADTDLGTDDSGYYFAVSADRPDLMESLNSAISEIDRSDPMFVTDNYLKHYGDAMKSNQLTPEEADYLESLEILKFGCLANGLPISGYDDSGELAGVASTLVPMLEEFTGVKVQPVVYDTLIEMEEALRSNEIDAAFPIFSDEWLSESKGMHQTAPIVSDRVQIAYLGEYRTGLLDRIAVSETGIGQRYFLSLNYPDSEQVFFDTRLDSLKAVEEGKADSIIGASSVLTRYIDSLAEFNDFNIAYLDGSENFCIGTNLHNADMGSVMKKAVSTLDTSLISDSMVKYSYVETPVTIKGVIQAYSVWIIALFVLVIAAILFAVHRWRLRVNAFNREQADTRVALEEALAAASAASDAKTTFLSSMSHDIRTPMNGIIGMTAIAAANMDDEERVKDCLTKITASSHHLLALINEILDVSKIESGKFELDEESFSMSDMLDDLIILTKPGADGKGQELTVNAVDIEHEQVVGDRTRLQQVFTNLVSNAVKYTDEGGTIDVVLQERPTGSPTAVCFDFTVTDNGMGMSEDFLPQVFDAFARASGKRVQKTQGTGLGLPIARNIARMMNGDITVESELGVGSTFKATVFLKASNETPVNYDEFVDLSVLVVDDDIVACESTCLLLDQLGMNSEWTLSGKEAVEIAAMRHDANNDFFVIILDWVMPEMDGKATIQALRERIGDDIPIIVVSAYDWSEIEIEARNAGAMSFVSKPLFKSNLVRLFDQLLGHEPDAQGKGLDDLTNEVSFKGKRALMAEDNELNAEIAIEFLGMTGMEVEHAENGQIALGMFESSEPGYYDCIFMDLQMPVMSGIESAEAIRASEHPDGKDIPIFAMTADAFMDDIKATQDVGMNEHFAKPLDFERVLSVVQGYLK